jgi:hypothetical protein
MAGSRRASFRQSNGGRFAYTRLPTHGGGNSGGGGGAWTPPRGGSGGGDRDRSPSGGGAAAAAAARDALRRSLRPALIGLPWAVLLLLAAAHSWRGRPAAALPELSLPGARACVGWRETYFCHPFA